MFLRLIHVVAGVRPQPFVRMYFRFYSLHQLTDICHVSTFYLQWTEVTEGVWEVASGPGVWNQGAF